MKTFMKLTLATTVAASRKGASEQHPHDDIRVQYFGGAGETRQHIVFRAAHHGDAFGRAEFDDRFVQRIGGGGDGDSSIRHKWHEGDILVWDNRCTLHTGTLYDDAKYSRVMHRLWAKGQTPA